MATSAGLTPRLHNTLSYLGAALLGLALAPHGRYAAVPPVLLWAVHFFRRSAEAMWVHRFSGRRVPLADALAEYAYYWGFAIWLARSLGDPRWDLPGAVQLSVGSALFLLGESGNAWAHRKLRGLRAAPGSSRRSIPRGGMFELVSCPHYLFEVISWTGFALVARTLAAWVFLALGAVILSRYAWVRHQRYRQEFDGQSGRALYPPGRRAIWLGIL